MKLQVTPRRFWSYSCAVHEGERLVAELKDTSMWGLRGEIRMGDQTYLARRKRGACLFESGDTVLATAVRPRRLYRTMRFDHAGHTFTLRARSSLGRAFDLLDGEVIVGSLCPEGVFSRRAQADLPETLPPWLQVFVIWLVMASWKESETVGVVAGVVVATSA